MKIFKKKLMFLGIITLAVVIVFTVTGCSDSPDSGGNDSGVYEKSPDIPTNVVATATSSNSITISWPLVSGALQYYVYGSDSSGDYTRLGVTVPTDTGVCSYVATGLSPDTSYSFAVSAYNKSGESSRSEYVYATTGFSAPTGLTVTEKTSNSITISWSHVYSAAGYRVYGNSSPSGSFIHEKTVSYTSYTATGLLPNTTYYYRVSAYDSVLESTQSSYISVTTMLETPTDVSVREPDTTTSSITINWSDVSGATTYYVYRASYSYDTYTRVGTVSTTSYTNTGLTSDTTYYYKVSAYNYTAGESEQSSYVSATTKLVAPTLGTISDITSNSLTVNWSTLSGATEYRVYRSTSSTGTYTQVGTSSYYTSYTDTGLYSNTTYYYKVSAYNSSAGESAQQTSPAQATTKLNAPTGLSVSGMSTGSITLSWNYVNGATQYRVYRSTTYYDDSSYTLVGSPTTTSYTNTGLTSGTTYYYKVSAYNSAGESERSSYFQTTAP